MNFRFEQSNAVAWRAVGTLQPHADGVDTGAATAVALDVKVIKYRYSSF